VILPAYNEGSSVSGVIAEVLATLDEAGIDGEVVVVDDGSTDGSVDCCFQEDPRVRVVTHPVNRGKGAAIRSGLEVARGRYVMIHDCDGEYPCEDIIYFFSVVTEGKVDVCFGSRLWRRPRMRRLHFVGNRVISLASSILLGIQVRDVMTGHKIFRRGLLDPARVKCSGFDVEVELTFLLLWDLPRERFYEYSIQYDARESGSKLRKVDGLRCLWRAARETLRH